MPFRKAKQSGYGSSRNTRKDTSRDPICKWKNGIRPLVVGLLGDSQIACTGNNGEKFANILANQLGADSCVLVGARGGYNTHFSKKILKPLMDDWRNGLEYARSQAEDIDTENERAASKMNAPDYIVVSHVNDTANPLTPANSASLEAYIQNYNEILTYLSDFPIGVAFMTPTPTEPIGALDKRIWDNDQTHLLGKSLLSHFPGHTINAHDPMTKKLLSRSGSSAVLGPDGVHWAYGGRSLGSSLIAHWIRPQWEAAGLNWQNPVSGDATDRVHWYGGNFPDRAAMRTLWKPDESGSRSKYLGPEDSSELYGNGMQKSGRGPQYKEQFSWLLKEAVRTIKGDSKICGPPTYIYPPTQDTNPTASGQ